MLAIMTNAQTHWLYPANAKFYDVFAALALPSTYWPMNSKVNISDQIFIYLAAPHKQIAYICEVQEIDLSVDDIMDEIRPFFKGASDDKPPTKPFMKIMKISDIALNEHSLVGYSFLKENGLNGMLMGPRKLENNLELLRYIKGVI